MNEEQNINQLPKDWKWVKLGDVCEKMSNGANAKQSDDKIGFPISRIETIWNETIDLGRVKYIEENDPAFVEKYSLKKDDILFSHINSDIHLGKTAIFKNQTKTLIHGINLLLIRMTKDALADFFNYQFRYKRRRGEFISIAQKSVNQSSINQPKLKNIDFVLPPNLTQQAIVSKIEELFSELDKGIENLRIAQQQLKTYRQSVLNTLITGKNYQTIESVLKRLDQGWSPRCENEASTDKTEWAVIKTSAVQYGHFLEFENKRLPKELKPREQHELMEGDILITRAGPRVRVGVCCMVRHTRPKLINCDKVYRIKVNNKIVTPEYFEYILNTPKYQDEIEKMKSGISDSGLNLTQKAFLQITIPVPTIDEQNKLVMEIESRLSVPDKMEESITQSLQQAEALRQSILKKAFEGRLV